MGVENCVFSLVAPLSIFRLYDHHVMSRNYAQFSNRKTRLVIGKMPDLT